MLLPSGPVVLVVDPDGATGDSARSFLDGYRVLFTRREEQALELLSQHRPDAVLMDAHFSEETRAAVMRGLRSQDEVPSPVLFMAATQDDDTLVRCFEEGAADLIGKPLNGRTLVARLDRAVREVVERRSLTAQAQTDALTGLANFRALSGRLYEEFTRAQRYSYPLAAVMIDLDRMKKVNDRFGHDAGNQAIRKVADHLRENLRGADFAARYGGDEFVVLLPHQSAGEANYFAERIRALRSLKILGADGLSSHLKLTLSIGVAAREPQHPRATAEQLLQAADAALYEAKRRGRNCVVTLDAPRPDKGDGSPSEGQH